MLSVHKVRPSQQRLMILEYLLTHHNHPSVDMIYNELLIKVPTLSRATVYNTLNLFLKAGLVRVLDIVENEARYDILTDFHGHFKCNTCGEIFNFRVIDEALVSEELKGFGIDDKNVYFKGTCPKCLKK
ncbi:MAG: transcriptional repressor [Acidaminobacter sp.]|nr:transcriptional repressor [Acidaminobacter sp.]